MGPIPAIISGKGKMEIHVEKNQSEVWKAKEPFHTKAIKWLIAVSVFICLCAIIHFVMMAPLHISYMLQLPLAVIWLSLFLIFCFHIVGNSSLWHVPSNLSPCYGFEQQTPLTLSLFNSTALANSWIGCLAHPSYLLYCPVLVLWVE